MHANNAFYGASVVESVVHEGLFLVAQLPPVEDEDLVARVDPGLVLDLPSQGVDRPPGLDAHLEDHGRLVVLNYPDVHPDQRIAYEPLSERPSPYSKWHDN